MLDQISQNNDGDDGVADNSGDDMKVKLSDDDRQAVDMLLDRTVTSGNGGNTPASAVRDGTFERRLGRVETILQLLSEMPAADPPADLAQRLMRRIEQTPNHLGAAAGSSQPTIDSTHPHV